MPPQQVDVYGIPIEAEPKPVPFSPRANEDAYGIPIEAEPAPEPDPELDPFYLEEEEEEEEKPATPAARALGKIPPIVEYTEPEQEALTEMTRQAAASRRPPSARGIEDLMQQQDDAVQALRDGGWKELPDNTGEEITLNGILGRVEEYLRGNAPESAISPPTHHTIRGPQTSTTPKHPEEVVQGAEGLSREAFEAWQGSTKHPLTKEKIPSSKGGGWSPETPWWTWAFDKRDKVTPEWDKVERATGGQLPEAQQWKNFDPLLVTPKAVEILKLQMKTWGWPADEVDAIPDDKVPKAWFQAKKAEASPESDFSRRLEDRMDYNQLKERASTKKVKASLRYLEEAPSETRTFEILQAETPDQQRALDKINAQTAGTIESALGSIPPTYDDIWEAYGERNLESGIRLPKKTGAEAEVALVSLRNKGWAIDVGAHKTALFERKMRELTNDRYQKLRDTGLSEEEAREALQAEWGNYAEDQDIANEYATRRITSLLQHKHTGIALYTGNTRHVGGEEKFTGRQSAIEKLAGPAWTLLKSPWQRDHGDIYEGHGKEELLEGRFANLVRIAPTTVLGSWYTTWDIPESYNPAVQAKSLYDHWGSPEHYEALTTGKWDIVYRFHDVGEKTGEILENLGLPHPATYAGEKALGMTLGIPAMFAEFDVFSLGLLGIGKTLGPLFRARAAKKSDRIIDKLEELIESDRSLADRSRDLRIDNQPHVDELIKSSLAVEFSVPQGVTLKHLVKTEAQLEALVQAHKKAQQTAAKATTDAEKAVAEHEVLRLEVQMRVTQHTQAELLLAEKKAALKLQEEATSDTIRPFTEPTGPIGKALKQAEKQRDLAKQGLEEFVSANPKAWEAYRDWLTTRAVYEEAVLAREMTEAARLAKAEGKPAAEFMSETPSQTKVREALETIEGRLTELRDLRSIDVKKGARQVSINLLRAERKLEKLEASVQASAKGSPERAKAVAAWKKAKKNVEKWKGTESGQIEAATKAFKEEESLGRRQEVLRAQLEALRRREGTPTLRPDYAIPEVKAKPPELKAKPKAKPGKLVAKRKAKAKAAAAKPVKVEVIPQATKLTRKEQKLVQAAVPVNKAVAEATFENVTIAKLKEWSKALGIKPPSARAAKRKSKAFAGAGKGKAQSLGGLGFKGEDSFGQIQRADDFKLTGDYLVWKGPRYRPIRVFRDTDQFSYPVWHARVGGPDGGIGYTKKEAIEWALKQSKKAESDLKPALTTKQMAAWRAELAAKAKEAAALQPKAAPKKPGKLVAKRRAAQAAAAAGDTPRSLVDAYMAGRKAAKTGPERKALWNEMLVKVRKVLTNRLDAEARVLFTPDELASLTYGKLGFEITTRRGKTQVIPVDEIGVIKPKAQPKPKKTKAKAKGKAKTKPETDLSQPVPDVLDEASLLELRAATATKRTAFEAAVVKELGATDPALVKALAKATDAQKKALLTKKVKALEKTMDNLHKLLDKGNLAYFNSQRYILLLKARAEHKMAEELLARTSKRLAAEQAALKKLTEVSSKPVKGTGGRAPRWRSDPDAVGGTRVTSKVFEHAQKAKMGEEIASNMANRVTEENLKAAWDKVARQIIQGEKSKRALLLRGQKKLSGHLTPEAIRNARDVGTLSEVVKRLPVLARARVDGLVKGGATLEKALEEVAPDIPRFVELSLPHTKVHRGYDQFASSVAETSTRVQKGAAELERVVDPVLLKDTLASRYGDRVVEEFLELESSVIPAAWRNQPDMSLKELLKQGSPQTLLPRQTVALNRLEDSLQTMAQRYWQRERGLDFAIQLDRMRYDPGLANLLGNNGLGIAERFATFFRGGTTKHQARLYSDGVIRIKHQVDDLTGRAYEEVNGIVNALARQAKTPEEVVSAFVRYMDGESFGMAKLAGNKVQTQGFSFFNQGTNIWDTFRRWLAMDGRLVQVLRRATGDLTLDPGEIARTALPAAQKVMEDSGRSYAAMMAKHGDAGGLKYAEELLIEFRRAIKKENPEFRAFDWSAVTNKSLNAVARSWVPQGTRFSDHASHLTHRAWEYAHVAPDYNTFMSLQKTATFERVRGTDSSLRAHHTAVLASANAKIMLVGVEELHRLIGPGLSPRILNNMNRVLEGTGKGVSAGVEGFREALHVFNELGMPLTRREMPMGLFGKAEKVHRKLIRLGDDPSGMNAFAPADLIHEFDAIMGKLEKELDPFNIPEGAAATRFEMDKLFSKDALKHINDQTLMRMYGSAVWAFKNAVGGWRRSVVVGLAVPNPRFWVNTSTGDFSQLYKDEDLATAARLSFQNLPVTIPFIGRVMQDALSKRAAEGDALGTMLGSIFSPHMHEFWNMSQAKAASTFIRDVKGGLHNVHELRLRAAADGILDTFVEERILLQTRKLIAKEGESPGAKAHRGWRDWNDDMAKMMVYGQQRQRLALWLEKVINQGVGYRAAQRSVFNSLYDWKHGVSEIELQSLAKITTFWRFWSLSARRQMASYLELIAKPTKEMLGKALTGKTQLAKIRNQIQTVRALPEFFDWEDPNARVLEKTQDEYDYLMKYVRPWWSEARPGGPQTVMPGAHRLEFQDKTGRWFTHYTWVGPQLTAVDLQYQYLTFMTGIAALTAAMFNSLADTTLGQKPFVIPPGKKFGTDYGYGAELTSEVFLNTLLPIFQDTTSRAMGGFRWGWQGQKLSSGEAALAHHLGLEKHIPVVYEDLNNQYRANPWALSLFRIIPFFGNQLPWYLSNYTNASPEMKNNLAKGLFVMTSGLLNFRRIPHSPYDTLKWEMVEMQKKLEKESKAAKLPVGPRVPPHMPE